MWGFLGLQRAGASPPAQVSILESAADAAPRRTLTCPPFAARGVLSSRALTPPINSKTPKVRNGLYFCVSPITPGPALLHSEGAYSSTKDKCQFVQVDLWVKEMMSAGFFLVVDPSL